MRKTIIIMRYMNAKVLFFIVLLTASSACVGNQGTHNSQTLRPEIVQMSIGEQRNMLLGCTAEEKATLWTIKIEDTLGSENLSSEEKAVISRLKKEITPGAFENQSSDQKHFQEVSADVERILVEKYGWSENKLFVYLMTIMTEKEIKDYNNIHKIKIEF